MKSFKKLLLAAVCFILLLATLSAIIIVPYLNSESVYYQDKYLRAELAGTLDFIAVGASHSMVAIDPRIVDSRLECNSYNLSNNAMTLYGREALLEKELDRNPVETVVIEFSFETLTRDQSSEYGEGDQQTMAKLDNAAERFCYLAKNMKPDDWLNIYSRDLERGMVFWKDRLLGASANAVDYSLKGFHAYPVNDLTMEKDEAVESCNVQTINTAMREENIEQLVSLIELCRAHDTKVILAVMPLSDRKLWSNDGWDEFYQWTVSFCKEHECELFDFNLLKDRFELFTDASSFHNDMHMSEEGAQVFTEAFCRVLKLSESGEDVSDLFFASYEEMKTFSPYTTAD